MLVVPDITHLSISDEAKKYLQEWWSKTWFYKFLTQTEIGKSFLQKHPRVLPDRTHILDPNDDDIDTFVWDIITDGTPYIVRWRHPADFMWAVDVFGTQSDIVGVFSAKKILEHIKNIRMDAQSDLVKSFMEYETGNPFDGKVGIMVQEYYGPQGWSIIEHPFDPNVYIIEDRKIPSQQKEYLCNLQNMAQLIGWVDLIDRAVHEYRDNLEAIRSTVDKSVETSVYNENSKPDMPTLWAKFWRNILNIISITDIYKSIKRTKLIPADYSYKLDFGFPIGWKDPIKIYQATLFRPFEEKATRSKQSRQTSLEHRAIGITPEEWITINMHDILNCNKTVGPSGYFYNNESSSHLPTPLNIQPNNMELYMGHNAGGRSMLSHGDYRWIQKSPLSMITRSTIFWEWKIQYYANGIQARRKEL